MDTSKQKEIKTEKKSNFIFRKTSIESCAKISQIKKIIIGIVGCSFLNPAYIEELSKI